MRTLGIDNQNIKINCGDQAATIGKWHITNVKPNINGSCPR